MATAEMFSSMPTELSNLSGDGTTKYRQRMAPYYTHLGRLAAQELRNWKTLQFAPYMVGPLHAMLLHAGELRLEHLDAQPQSQLVQSVLYTVYGQEFKGKDYVGALIALEEGFADPCDYSNKAVEGLARFSETFADRVETFVKTAWQRDIQLSSRDILNNPVANRKLPFIAMCWAGTYSGESQENRARPPVPVSQTAVAPQRTTISFIRTGEITVPRDHGVLRARFNPSAAR